MNKKKKKIITIAVSVIIIFIITALVFGIIYKKTSSAGDVSRDIQNKKSKVNEVENVKNIEKEVEISKENSSNILMFTKDTGILNLYNDKGKLIDNMDLKTLSLPNVVNEHIEEIENEEPRYETFRTINNDLIFKDFKEDLLIQVDVKDEKILSEILLKDISLKGLTSVDIAEDDIYLTLEGNLNVLKVRKGQLEVEKYELESIPYFVTYENGYIYYLTKDKIGKINTRTKNNEKITVNIGDSVSSTYEDGNYLFIISEFTKSKDSSVLIKISKENLSVSDIMELKGTNSVFIGNNDDSAYIRQKDSIKEIDLKTFKLKTIYSREEGIPVQINTNKLYTLKDSTLEIFNLDVSKKISSFEVDGFTFQIFN